ncbi:hypothetical protein TNCV_1900111 [Trichonephila clavipes]|nr:hypothetical protein TNCV_1900111 [Trichonephila clavipes]
MLYYLPHPKPPTPADSLIRQGADRWSEAFATRHSPTGLHLAKCCTMRGTQRHKLGKGYTAVYTLLCVEILRLGRHRCGCWMVSAVVTFRGGEEFGGRGGVGYLCLCLSQSQTCCDRGSRALLPWKRISRTVGRGLQCNAPFAVTSIFLHEVAFLLIGYVDGCLPSKGLSLERKEKPPKSVRTS